MGLLPSASSVFSLCVRIFLKSVHNLLYGVLCLCERSLRKRRMTRMGVFPCLLTRASVRNAICAHKETFVNALTKLENILIRT